jgi:hypothetical protein
MFDNLKGYDYTIYSHPPEIQMLNPKTISPREAVCQYMGWEFNEAHEYRYHYGRTIIPVYSTIDGVICAVKNGKKPPKIDPDDNHTSQFDWVEATGITAEYIKTRGKTIYINKKT